MQEGALPNPARKDCPAGQWRISGVPHHHSTSPASAPCHNNTPLLQHLRCCLLITTAPRLLQHPTTAAPHPLQHPTTAAPHLLQCAAWRRRRAAKRARPPARRWGWAPGHAAAAPACSPAAVAAAGAAAAGGVAGAAAGGGLGGWRLWGWARAGL